MQGLGWLLAAGLALAGLAVPAYAERDELTIDWTGCPLAVAVPSTACTFTIEDSADPQGDLFAAWQDDPLEPLPHLGQHTMNFDSGTELGGVISIVRCVDGCAPTGVSSPELTVWKESPMTLGGVSGVVRPGERTAEVDLPDAPDTELELTWKLSYGGTSYGDGTVPVTTDDDGHATFPYTVPTGRSGRLGLTARTSFDQPPFGPHRAVASPAYFDVDQAAPTLSLSLGTTSVYPATDGYRDRLTIRYGTSEQVSQRVDIRNAAGTVVRTLATGTLGSGHSGAARTITWNGRDSADNVVPAGSYTVRFDGVDRVGRSATVARSVTVSHKKLVQKTWQRVVRAGDAVARGGAIVGSCSSLRRPARSDWPGSLGLHSRTKCQRAADSPVTVLQRAAVPKAFEGRYGRLQIWLYGGGARGLSGGGRGARIDLGYASTAGPLAQRVRFGGTVGSHAGRSAYAPNFVHAKFGSPYVKWLVGVNGGSKYDVRSYTLKLTYFLLQE
ncbi:FlgD immunoglobulin-like domain containing protein [Nocardioides speluncae]|uniref:FlgD immunoglobulin-like domain containing protein n=1 Tax=Nocardioides speluncae TaxID=2670337 RepID=UPI0012B165A2|nr:FlgD immunoglobulin-like domain containing protein [Nocardioides speluncae]